MQGLGLHKVCRVKKFWVVGFELTGGLWGLDGDCIGFLSKRTAP